MRPAGDGHAPRFTSSVARVPEPDPATRAAARRIVLAHAQRKRWPRQDVADVLAMLGLMPPRKGAR